MYENDKRAAQSERERELLISVYSVLIILQRRVFDKSLSTEIMESGSNPSVSRLYSALWIKAKSKVRAELKTTSRLQRSL